MIGQPKIFQTTFSYLRFLLARGPGGVVLGRLHCKGHKCSIAHFMKSIINWKTLRILATKISYKLERESFFHHLGCATRLDAIGKSQTLY